VYEGACLSSKAFLILFALALCLSGAVYDVVTICAKMLNQMIKYIFPMMIIINQCYVKKEQRQKTYRVICAFPS
jgi:hypothetical protein